MEPEQERLDRIMERTGVNEQEAHALYHLGEARQLVAGLMPGPENVDLAHLAAVSNSFRTIENVIAIRVLERRYPEGWSAGSGGESLGSGAASL
jgi:hypothetical protein